MPRKSNDKVEDYKDDEYHEPTEGIRTMEYREEDRKKDEADKSEHEHHDETPAEKVAAKVEPETDPLKAVEDLVCGVVAAFEAKAGTSAGEIEDLVKHFAENAGKLAEAALANAEKGFKQSEEKRGYDPKHKVELSEQAHAYGAGHDNTHAVRSAVAHGMDEDEARAMTGHGSNT